MAKDYNTYKIVLQQKREQLRALQTISNYISETSSNIKQSEHVLQESRMQQREILADIEKIKGNKRTIVL